ncbi:MAG: carbonic anhydrase [Patescibacteria group bacterium]
MQRLVEIQKPEDIFPEYQGTPIADLLAYHNFEREYGKYEKAQMLIGMCMDNRKRLHIPRNFAFILRAGGANLRSNEFKVAFSIAVGGVKYIALIGHNSCNMVNLQAKREEFVTGLVERAGCSREWAEQHFMDWAPMFEIVNEVDFLLNEAKRLRSNYPKIVVVPMLYNVHDNNISLIRE